MRVWWWLVGLQALSQIYLDLAEPLNPAMPPHKSNFLKTQGVK